MGWWGKWKPVLVMLAIVVAYAVMNIMIKKAIDEGTNRLLLITLRQLIAALILSPIAYFRERYKTFHSSAPIECSCCVHHDAWLLTPGRRGRLSPPISASISSSAQHSGNLFL